jgi:hypothetical protein
VPQGSINGPSFYVLFFNDICNVNYEKPKYMIVSKKQNNNIDDNAILRCNGKNIERVYSFKYLGIHLDSNYSFDVHFDSVLSRVGMR